MAKELKRIDISGEAALIRLVDEVRSSHEPRLLELHNEEVAVLSPVRPGARSRTARTPKKADRDAFLSSFGSWKGFDVDKFLADNYESRRRSSRPPVEL